MGSEATGEFALVFSSVTTPEEGRWTTQDSQKDELNIGVSYRSMRPHHDHQGGYLMVPKDCEPDHILLLFYNNGSAKSQKSQNMYMQLGRITISLSF